ncbi:adhesion G-protein coupled receptor G1-like isoform X2 [Brachyhypopomus gauderio]|uniref:adhesion G-protein coupled receptor G1-like isoform X2 n=1 Tax=Brachyhypopomus gauderio TaxID=698409 RepID=UPI0040432EFA
MGPVAMGTVQMFVLLTALWGHVAVETDRDFRMCGVWRHNHERPKLLYRLTPGCDIITISANGSTLTVQGSITAQCSNQSSWPLDSSQVPLHFCVIWEPLLDMLTLQVNGVNITLCHARGLQSSCCTHLSAKGQSKPSMYGIQDASVHGDPLSPKTIAEYSFQGDKANCMQEFCGKVEQEPSGANMIEEAVLKSGVMGRVHLPCAQSTVMELKEDFTGHNVTLPVPRGVPPNRIPSVHLPAGLRPAQRKTAKVVCTYFTNSTLFQMSSNKILEDVVGISVENEIITDLPHPVIITFRHSGIMKTHTATCVSWDTRTDPEVRWREEGCVTVSRGAQETQCQCYHLTYFAILVQVNPTTLRHLEALTFITAVGCALSAVSCLVLFVFLCRQKRGSDQSSLMHRGLVVSLFFLCVLFVLTGTVANVGHERVCHFMGALLHYMLLSSLCWMGVEVLHTFQMVYMVFSLSPKPWIWYLVGFGVPVVPVVILACMGNIYGQRTITETDGVENPYHMCWMLDSQAALVAHCITTVGLLAAVVTSGFVMLFLVIRVIHHRPEWRNKRVAFLSIWGLSCLFGSTWGLTFFSFGPLSETVLFLFCIINSLQGFFLMLRFYVLARMQKRSKNISDGTSSGSTRQHMLQGQDKRELATPEDEPVT